MHIGFLGGAVSRLGGGLFEAQVSLSAALGSLGYKVSAYGTLDQFSEQDKARWGIAVAQAFPSLTLAGFAWSRSMRAAVLKSPFDVLHIHTLWTHSSIIAQQWQRHNRKPYIVTPHGMLDEWAIRNSGIKKRIALQLFEHKTLQRAACINAHTLKELTDIRNLGIATPVAVIPNGVDIPMLDSDHHSTSASKKMLFLGRLHPKKGLPLLLEAWASLRERMRQEGWQLLIGGWDQNGHQLELSSRCQALGLRSAMSSFGECTEDNKAIQENIDVAFLGPIFGKSKHRLMQEVDAFVLPSLSEGLPIAVLEAWSYQIPSLITTKCNLPEAAESGISLVVEPTSRCIREGLIQFLDLKPDQLKSMGVRAREFAKVRFSWGRVAEQLALTYQWVVGDAKQPSFVDR